MRTTFSLALTTSLVMSFASFAKGDGIKINRIVLSPALTALSKNLSHNLDNQTPATPIAPPVTSPSTNPARPVGPVCTVDFVREYLRVAGELSTVGTFMNASEDAPNLLEAAFACGRIQKDFPTTSCTVPSDTAPVGTVDFKDVCAAVAGLYKDANGGQDVELGPVAPALVSDATSVILLEAPRLSLTVKAPAELQKALDQSSELVVISGHALDLEDALNSDADVRCTLQQAKNSHIVFAAGDVLKVSHVTQMYRTGYRAAVISIADKDLQFVCLTDSEMGVKYGDLRGAFVGLFGFDYQR